jgi:spermidine synthase
MRYQTTLTRLQNVFDIVRPYSVFIPLYGALWGMAMASKSSTALATPDPELLDQATIQDRLDAQGISQLQFYSAARHASLFAN